MARYYEETALIEFVKQYTPTINGETTMECVERAIREAPTADVAPKTEVDELRAEIEKLTINMNAYGLAAKRLAEEKTEVAKELLSDLKKAVHDKAVYSYTKEMYPYINLKVFDAVIADYLKRLEEKNNG